MRDEVSSTHSLLLCNDIERDARHCKLRQRSFMETLIKSGIGHDTAAYLNSASTYNSSAYKNWPSVTGKDFRYGYVQDYDTAKVEFSSKYSLRTWGNSLIWEPIITEASMSFMEETDPFPFRKPAECMLEIVESSLGLLDDACIRISKHSTTRRKEQLVHTAVESLQRGSLSAQKDEAPSCDGEKELLHPLLARHMEALTDSTLQMVGMRIDIFYLALLGRRFAGDVALRWG